MTALAQRAWADRLRGIGVRQVRLTCGLVLFSYLVAHFANHALGNISYSAMAAWLPYHMAFWRHPVVTVILYGAGIVHWSLGLYALYERRAFRYRRREVTQLALGLSIPFLLAAHLIGNRMQHTFFDRDLHYAQAMLAYWVNRPWMHWVQYVLLVVAWVHGCIGLYFWLRLKNGFLVAAPYLLAFAILMPVLALLGLAHGATEVVAMRNDLDWRNANLGYATASADQRAFLDSLIVRFLIAYAIVVALVFAARGLRRARERRRGLVALTYPGRLTVRVPRGMSVLEASLLHNVPHASVCGGKARCSTCRIRVLGDPATLPAPSGREAFVLDRVGASKDPAVRLACQLRPERDLAFLLVFPPTVTARTMRTLVRAHPGEERYIVSMFVDMRRSTALAEKRLPFDTMFIVNRFVGAIAQAVEDAGGRPNVFVGDGMLALFGVDCDADEACRRAVDALARLAIHMAALNADLAGDLREPIRYGAGVNGGNAIVGDIGHREHVVFTALGDAVNVAARLQDLTKQLGCIAVVAEEVCRRAGLAADAAVTHEMRITGRGEAMIVRALTDVTPPRAVEVAGQAADVQRTAMP